MVFNIPLFDREGKSFKTNVHITANTGWACENLAKSGGLILPPALEPFTMSTDDIESRRLYVNVTHKEYNGQPSLGVSFVTQEWAEQQNPDLVGITFPREAPRDVPLRAVPLPPENPPKDDSQGGAGVPASPPAPQPPTAAEPLPPKSEVGDISDEEFAEAIRIAKQIREGKKD
jgi:hypothetical protein